MPIPKLDDGDAGEESRRLQPDISEDTQQPMYAVRDYPPVVVVSIADSLSDVIFTLLPVVLMVMVLTHFRGFQAVFRSPETSFAAAVLFGQTIAKLIKVSNRGRAYEDRVVLLLSLLIVFGLCPTLFVLLFLLAAEATSVEPSRLLMISQLLLLVASIFCYITFGTMAKRSRLGPDDR